MFKIFENDKEATILDGKYECWKNCEFKTFYEATIYARQWLGIYEPPQDYQWKLEIPYSFQEGCYITIRELN